MIISHNLLAMSAQRQFNITGNQKKKSTEKLSSGYRINRSADDAAGLAISEKMRRQIRGLNQGARNIQDGISMLQVADGALEEVQDMLHRVTELSVKAANGTNFDSDREAIQQEITEILAEIDRISDTTEFNERKLFQGGDDNGSSRIIGYRTETTTNTNYIPQTDSFAFAISGNSTDNTAKTYTVDAYSNANGLKIGTDVIPWSNIKNSENESVNISNDVTAGNYSFDYKGMTVSFDVGRDVTGAEFKWALNGLKFNTKKEDGEYLSFSLYASTPKDYTATLKAYDISATEEGIIVNDELYTWPESLTENIEANKTYEFSAGNVDFNLTIGTKNTASLSDIIEKIGSKRIVESQKTGLRSIMYNMSLDYNRDDRRTVGEIRANPSIIAGDAEGICIRIGDEYTEKKTWAELGISTEGEIESKEYTYQAEGVTFKFTTSENTTFYDLSHLNIPLSIKTAGYRKNYDLKTYKEFDHGAWDIHTIGIDEATNWYRIQNMSFGPIDSETPTYESASGYNTYPSSTQDTPLNHVFKRNETNYLELSSGFIGQNSGFVLQNPDDLEEYFNQRNAMISEHSITSGESGSVDLYFASADGSKVNIKLTEKYYDIGTDRDTLYMTMDQFVDAITDKAYKTTNNPKNLVVLEYPCNDDNVDYKVKLSLKDRRLDTRADYADYGGYLNQVNEDKSTILPDEIQNIPTYTYYKEETTEGEVQIPIYAEGDEGDQSFWIQSGSEAGDGMYISISAMNKDIIGLTGVDVSTIDGAGQAINAAGYATKIISGMRANLGAQQNRLEHTYRNVTNIAENTQAAESQIRDTDMAKEMVELSNHNILEQMGTSMITQANQSRQGVLSLLQ